MDLLQSALQLLILTFHVDASRQDMVTQFRKGQGINYRSQAEPGLRWKNRELSIFPGDFLLSFRVFYFIVFTFTYKCIRLLFCCSGCSLQQFLCGPCLVFASVIKSFSDF
jgi:hypothetical protein